MNDALWSQLSQASHNRLPMYEAGNAEHKADWLSPVATALGAGVGFMVGGPAGAAYGASLGSSTGHVVQGKAGVGDYVNLGTSLVAPGMSLFGGADKVSGMPATGNWMPSGGLPEPMGFADGGEVTDPFQPLSADPAMQAAMGIQPVPDLTTRDRIVQALGKTLGSLDLTSLVTPRQKGYQKALTLAGTAAAKTFGNYEQGKADERQARIEANNKRMGALNAADINDMLARRRKKESDAESEAKKREGWPVVPVAWAKAAGREDLAGQRVDPGTYRGLSDTFSAWRDANKPTPDRLTPEQQFRLDSNKRRFGTRIEQVKNRMESIQKRLEDPLYADDPELMAKVSSLADTLAQIQDQWDAADQKVYSGAARGGSVRGNAPAPATPAAPAPTGPQVFQKDVKIQLGDGRTGTLKAGAPLPAGAKVIGG